MDIVICNFPPMWPWYLPAAPAVLFGACKQLNLSYDFVDIALLDKKQNNHPENWAQIVIGKKPKLVVFSIFSYLGQPYAEKLAIEIKKLNSELPIMIGGKGIKDSLNDTNLNFVNKLLSKNLINFFHDGDSEQHWPNFLIDFFKLSYQTPIKYFADFSKYELLYYQNQANISNQKLLIPVTSSVGCVRKCTFCDVHQHWKFTQRDPDETAKEIRECLQQVPYGNIYFTDSLVNGNITAFNKLLNHLTDIKKTYPDMFWTGQIIVRNEKTATDEYWRKIAESGARELQMGVETGSDRLRTQMRKNFTNHDLDTTLKYMEKYKLTCHFLILVGYPTETLEDFQATVDMLYKYKHYAGNVIIGLELGHTMTINPGTPVYDESVGNPNMILSKDIKIWFNRQNPSLTFNERIRRRNELEKVALDLGYDLSFDNHTYKEENTYTFEKHKKIIHIMENKATEKII